MASIRIKAFVHTLDSVAKGFIYARLFTERGAHFVRISSADENGAVQVYRFSGRAEMFGDAENQSRLNENLILADESLVKNLDFASTRMLVDVLREQHSYLFQEMRFAC